MLVGSLPIKSKEEMECDLFYNSATQAGLVYDVTDKD